jgi:hypothetical protein
MKIGIKGFMMFDDYEETMTSNSWKYLLDNCVVYPDKNRFKADIADSLYVDLFIEKHSEMKEQNKRFVVIIEDTEGHWFENKLHINLHKVLEEAKIPPQDILFITNDYHVDKHYSDWCETMGIKEKINVLSLPFFVCRMLDTFYGIHYTSRNNSNPNMNVKIKNLDTIESKKPNKKFIALMGGKTYSRSTMWNFYENNKFIKEQGHISYLGKNIVLPNSWKTEADKKRILKSESNFSIDNLVQYHQDSYFSVVAETGSGLMLSEKILKPIVHCHPFMVFNNNDVGYLKLLKKYGFETFPEWFDESYDEIEDNDARFRFIQKEITRLCNMSNEHLSELYKSVEDKLIHNKNNFLNFDLVFERKFIKDLTEISK